MTSATAEAFGHTHVFLGSSHEQAERRTWIVITLCGVMMVLEIIGGLLFGSIALVADGLHMTTHASALLLAALAYRYARHYAHDPRFTFGTGKLGDLAGFTSAIVLAMIPLLIGYEAIYRLFMPIPISFAEAIPLAMLGLIVNVVSALLLSGGLHHHGHSHGHHAGAPTEHHIETLDGVLTLPPIRPRTPTPALSLSGRACGGHCPASSPLSVAAWSRADCVGLPKSVLHGGTALSLGASRHW
ncbi:MAG: CDF family Co(II)/Ni(II) efflux transporter DmeF [Rhodopila sp.]